MTMDVKLPDNELDSYINWGDLTEQTFSAATNVDSSLSSLNLDQIDLNSVYILMNNENNFLHKFHQPSKCLILEQIISALRGGILDTSFEKVFQYSNHKKLFSIPTLSVY